MKDIETKLRTFLPDDRLKFSLVDRVAFAGDAGFYQLIPRCVVEPRSDIEIGKLFKTVHELKVPLVFRAAGTSLSGQAITDGILADISKFWVKADVLKNGELVKVQPGVIGARVNMILAGYGRKIGPDPASINAAMMGGILSNNASGMCCGVTYNSYHTLKSLRFMLPDGNIFDTAQAKDYARFEKEEPILFKKLLEWRQLVFNHKDLFNEIRRKYRMKNTVGYGLNALVDYEHPLDMFSHLMVGAEGTLGFISEAILHTIPDLPFKSAAVLYFRGISEACSVIGILKEAGAEALELMDRNALKSVEHLPGLPDFFKDLPDGAAALLCEFQAENKEALASVINKALLICTSLPLLHHAVFTEKEQERQFYWKIRKGMFPSVGAVRKRGTTVILEDIGFPVDRLADAVSDLQALFGEFGYENAIIFGHAKEGNIHFVITQMLNASEEVARYDAFMQKVVKLVLEKYGGALKAEHGTGRNMAPFVEAEWGGVAYSIMKELKQLVDPLNLLNPGVIINTDPLAHLQNLKQMPEVEPVVDKCIECGFCEHHCPSKNVTLTPRQRIQVRRHLKNLKAAGKTNDYKTLLEEYQYAGLDTCATDGLCQMDCPVEINTGELVKQLRNEQHGVFANRLAKSISSHFGVAETAVRILLKTGNGANKLLGRNFMWNFTSSLRKLLPVIPRWWNELTIPPEKEWNDPANPEFVYLSACIQRTMGNDKEQGGIQAAFLNVCKKAGVQLLLPKEVHGQCCGQAFSSKGFFEAAHIRQRELINALWIWTKKGEIPVVCDFTSCTYTLIQAAKTLEEPYKSKLKLLRILDSISFLKEVILPKLKVMQKKGKVVLHPGCAAMKMQLVQSMKEVAMHCATEVVIPTGAGCCGMAGDRGFLFPELIKGATADELNEVEKMTADGYYGSAKTCEMALSHISGKPYRHLIYLVNEMFLVKT